ncbi:protein dalmatian [Drosophila subobscura]|nr:protein dalmatian [Drosophila subobscura]
MAGTPTTMPDIRRCVVKVKRIKPNESVISKGKESISKLKGGNISSRDAIACDTSVFQPCRNSTMCVAKTPKAQKMNVTAANLTSANITPLRIRLKRMRLPSPKPVETATATTVQPAATSPVHVNKGPLAKPAEAETNTSVQSITPVRVRIKRLPVARPAETATAAQSTTTQASEQGHRFFHRDQPPTRTRSSVTRNVYEFLSQSQIEDGKCREDPAADIIKKMVKAGKACVMVRSKKDGKLRAKPIKKVRPVGKRRQCSLKNLENAKPKEDTIVDQMPTAAPLSPIPEPHHDVDSSDVEAPNAAPFEVSVSVHSPPQARFSVQRKSSSMQHHPSPSAVDGAYSHLARSVLLHETKTHDPQNSMERRRQLVNMARKFVSTPLNRKSPNSNVTASAISPIPRQTVLVSPSGGASPWRVSDESAMPNTFVFGFNTSQLPSYSSDHIQRRRHVYVPDEAAEAAPVEEPTEQNLANDESICPALHAHSLGSNANDSNEENMTPPAGAHKTLTTSNDQEDVENIENVVHLPNPRRTLQERAPLKDINILDVVMLPSWKKNTQNTTITPTKASTPARTSSLAIQSFGFDEFLEQEESPRRSSPPAKRKKTLHTPSKCGNLFGFEEFIEEDESAACSSQAAGKQNVTLHEKLQRLRELRPTGKELSQVSNATLSRSVECFGELEPRQRDIRDVMCSTMLAAETPKRQAALAADASAALFRDSDPEPETTFDEKTHRRTYVKEKPKRKRKQRVQVLYIDSGSSDDEDEENEPDSRDNSVDSPKKRAPGPPHKRSRKDMEHEAKMQQFITSFNKECEEVQQFPMVIE